MSYRSSRYSSYPSSRDYGTTSYSSYSSSSSSNYPSRSRDYSSYGSSSTQRDYSSYGSSSRDYGSSYSSSSHQRDYNYQSTRSKDYSLYTCGSARASWPHSSDHKKSEPIVNGNEDTYGKFNIKYQMKSWNFNIHGKIVTMHLAKYSNIIWLGLRLAYTSGENG